MNDKLLVIGAIMWIVCGFYSLARMLSKGVTHPVGDGLLGGVMVVTGPIGLLIQIACDASLKPPHVHEWMYEPDQPFKRSCDCGQRETMMQSPIVSSDKPMIRWVKMS